MTNRNKWVAGSKTTENLRWVWVLFFFSVVGCTTPPVHAVRGATVEWHGLVAPGACPSEFPYRVQVRDEHICENRTSMATGSVRTACTLAAQEWTTEIIRNSEMIGCSADRFRSQDVPLLYITLRSIKFDGGGSRGVACAASWIYGAGLLYSVIDAEHSVTTRADVELRRGGHIIWSGEIYGQERVDRDMWDVGSMIYEKESNSLGRPLRAALEALRNRIFVQTGIMNARLRGQSS